MNATEEIIRFRRGAIAPALAYSTAFQLTENPISEGGIWDNGLAVAGDWQNMRTTGGIACGTIINAGGAAAPNGPFDDNCALLKSSFIRFPRDHFIESTLFVAGGYTPGVSHEWEHLHCGTMSSGNLVAVEVLFSLNAAQIEVVRWNGPSGDFDPLDSFDVNAAIGRSFIDDDVVKSGRSGTDILVWLNGVLRMTVAESTVMAGQPGIGAWARNGATLTSYGAKSTTFGVL